MTGSKSVAMTLDLGAELQRLVPYGFIPARVTECKVLVELCAEWGKDGGGKENASELVEEAIAGFSKEEARAYRLLLLLSEEARQLPGRSGSGVAERRAAARKAIRNKDSDDRWFYHGEFLFLVPLAERCIDIALPQRSEERDAEELFHEPQGIRRPFLAFDYAADYYGTFVEINAARSSRQTTVVLVFRAKVLSSGRRRPPLFSLPFRIHSARGRHEVLSGGSESTVRQVYGDPHAGVLEVTVPELGDEERHTLIVRHTFKGIRNAEPSVDILPELDVRTAIIRVTLDSPGVERARAYVGTGGRNREVLPEVLERHPLETSPVHIEHWFQFVRRYRRYRVAWDWTT